MSATICEQVEAMRRRYARAHHVEIDDVGVRYFEQNGIEDAEVWCKSRQYYPSWTLGHSEVKP